MGPRSLTAIAALLGALAVLPSSIRASAMSAAELQVTTAARGVHPGELVLVTVTGPVGLEDVHVRAFDRQMPAFADGTSRWRALVGIDLDVKPGTYPVAIEGRAAGAVLGHTEPLHVVSHVFPTRTLVVNEEYVNPPAEVTERIEREAKVLGAIWNAAPSERMWSGPFVRPVPGRAVSSFGVRSVFNGQSRSPHGGTDFMSPSGTPIRAPNGGRAVLARDLYFSGNTIIIDHGLGVLSLLAHLSAFEIAEGATVARGQIVGRVGATGRVTGAHLHWAIRAAGARVDPLSLLALLGSAASNVDTTSGRRDR